jgi:hypothetical protein
MKLITRVKTASWNMSTRSSLDSTLSLFLSALAITSTSTKKWIKGSKVFLRMNNYERYLGKFVKDWNTWKINRSYIVTWNPKTYYLRTRKRIEWKLLILARVVRTVQLGSFMSRVGTTAPRRLCSASNMTMRSTCGLLEPYYMSW